MSPEDVSGSGFEDESLDEIDDDFLYHLYQGGDLLRSDRVVEAKEHLEKAFSLKPANPRGQNLLGLVYFKLGLYQRAMDIYRELVERYPDDPTLRVNLAMVELKADQLDEAESQLRRAIELNPDYDSAHRYLGLVLVRQGDTDKAKEHFIKAGVRNVEHLVGDRAGDEMSENRREEVRQAQQKALAEVADQGFRELEEKDFPFRDAGAGSQADPGSTRADPDAAGPGRDNGGWLTHETGREVVSPDQLLAGFTLDEGALLVRCPGPVYCRLGPIAWAEGELTFAAVNKRFGGQETKHLFDRGERAVVRVDGEGLMRFEPPDDLVYHRLRGIGESAYFLEELIFAFLDTSAWENGRLATNSGTDMPIFHLFGQTEVVLACPGRLVRRVVNGERRLRMPARRLAGWVGNLVPRLFEAEAPLTEEVWIELTGQGEVLSIA